MNWKTKIPTLKTQAQIDKERIEYATEVLETTTQRMQQRHESEIRKLRESNKRSLEAVERERKKAIAKTLKPLMDKWFKTRAVLPEPGDHHLYRIVVDINAEMIQDALEWGNSEAALDHIAEDLADRVRHEIRSMNFHRLNKYANRYERV
jgi:leucyl aminopeptidase (aminopeptidase T)